MSKRILATRLIVALLGAVTANACSGESPVTPSPAVATTVDLSAKPSAGVPGVYDLSFNVWRDGSYQNVSSMAVNSGELLLRARVTDSSGAPALRGTVTFEYCSYRGGPRNDIERADEAPKEACEQGSAAWARLTSRSISAGGCPPPFAGYACTSFPNVLIPRDIGFRFRYAPQGSGIPAGETAPENFTWTEGS